MFINTQGVRLTQQQPIELTAVVGWVSGYSVFQIDGEVRLVGQPASSGISAPPALGTPAEVRLRPGDRVGRLREIPTAASGPVDARPAS